MEAALPTLAECVLDHQPGLYVCACASGVLTAGLLSGSPHSNGSDPGVFRKQAPSPASRVWLFQLRTGEEISTEQTLGFQTGSQLGRPHANKHPGVLRGSACSGETNHRAGPGTQCNGVAGTQYLLDTEAGNGQPERPAGDRTPDWLGRGPQGLRGLQARGLSFLPWLMVASGRCS